METLPVHMRPAEHQAFFWRLGGSTVAQMRITPEGNVRLTTHDTEYED